MPVRKTPIEDVEELSKEINMYADVIDFSKYKNKLMWGYKCKIHEQKF